MAKRTCVFLCLIGALAWLGLPLSAAVQKVSPDRSSGPNTTHLQRGRASFEQAVYGHLPKNERAAAAAAFAAAARELDLAVQDDPNNGEAHRLLGRLHTLRGNHLEAAAHFRRLTEVDPFDLDSYALAASALAEAGRFGEARTELERAKGRAIDPRTVALLDGYLAKLAEAEKRAGAGR